jgi:site-specific recombinase XerD
MASVFKPPGYRSYVIEYVDEQGRKQRVKGYRDKSLSERRAVEIEKLVEKKKAGEHIEMPAFAQEPLESLTRQYLAELVRLGSPEDGPHVKEVRRTLKEVLAATAWQFLKDVKPDAMTALMRVTAGRGRSPRTQNVLLIRTRAFLNWCVAQAWIRDNPLRHVKLTPEGHAGKRYRRRAYTRDELGRLLAAVPEYRRHVYLTAALSGFRKDELRHLEKRDLTPAGQRPRWHARPEVTKSGRLEVVPIVPDLLPVIVPIWDALPNPTDRLFPVIPRARTFRHDLRRAAIERIDAEGRHADFHALRYTFCRLMGEVLPIQKVKVLMRHSTIKLTADLYTVLGIDDLGEDVWNLPKVLPAQDGRPVHAIEEKKRPAEGQAEE